MTLLVRAPSEYGNGTFNVDVSDVETMWLVKVKAYEFIPIPPHRMMLFILGETKELENANRIRDYPQLRHMANDARLIFVKDRDTESQASSSKRPKGSKQKQKGLRLLRGKKLREAVQSSNCFAGGRGMSKGIVGLPCTIKLYPISKDYQLVATKDRSAFDVLVTKRGSDDGESIASVMYDVDKEGIVHATWIPPEAGRYTIIVTLYDMAICNSPLDVTIIDHENSGRKVKQLLQDPKWRGEPVNVLADWAAKEEFHKEIFNEIGLHMIMELINSEPQDLIKPAMGIVLDRLVEKDAVKSMILEQGGIPALMQLAELYTAYESVNILRFISRAFASVGSITILCWNDNEVRKLPGTQQLLSKCNVEVFKQLEKLLCVVKDTEAMRNIARALAAFSTAKVYLSLLAEANLFPHLVSLYEGCTDIATRRYALHAIANWANSESSFQRRFFTDARVHKLLNSFEQPFTEDALITDAVRALANLAATEDYARLMVQNPSSIDRIIRYLSGTDSLTAWELKSSLSLLPGSVDKEEFGRFMSKSYQKEVNFNIESTRLLANILTKTKEGLGKIYGMISGPETITNLVQFIKSTNLQLQFEACKTISIIAQYEDCRKTVVKVGGVNALCAALNTASMDAIPYIVQSLAQVPLEVKSVLVNIIGDAGIDKLIVLLRQSNPELQRATAILLASLAGSDGCSRIVGQGGVAFLKNLMDLVRRGEVNVQNEIDPSTVEYGELIGQGISGIVYKAKWNGQEVAVKNFDENSIAFNYEEFRSELALMSVLRHENIVHCIGSSTQPESLFIVSELFIRGSVCDVLANKSIPVPIQLAVSMALDAAKGMKYLHTLGIIHRDLKTGNLLVNEHWQVKVADFGLSRMADKTMTRGVGTPIYTAPEVLASSIYSFKADVYSFAFIMWELISRELPYADLSPFEAVRRASDENLRPPIPENCVFEGLIQRCWAKDPEARPTFDTLVEALQEITNIVGGGSAGGSGSGVLASSSGSGLGEEDDQELNYAKINTMIGRTLRGGGGTGTNRSRAGASGAAGAAGGGGGASAAAERSTLLANKPPHRRKGSINNSGSGYTDDEDQVYSSSSNSSVSSSGGGHSGSNSSSSGVAAAAAAASSSFASGPSSSSSSINRPTSGSRRIKGADKGLGSLRPSRRGSKDPDASGSDSDSSNSSSPASGSPVLAGSGGGSSSMLVPPSGPAPVPVPAGGGGGGGSGGGSIPTLIHASSSMEQFVMVPPSLPAPMPPGSVVMSAGLSLSGSAAAGGGGGAANLRQTADLGQFFHQQQHQQHQQQQLQQQQQFMRERDRHVSDKTGASATVESHDICQTCNLPVPASQCLRAMDRIYHQDCFVCYHCRKRLVGSFCRYQDKPYCNEDYKLLFSPRCARCQQLLTGQYFNALNKSWHKDCFVCTRCGKGMQKFYDIGGFPYCDGCS